LQTRQIVSRPSHKQAIAEKAVPTALAQFVRRHGALRSEVRPVYADHVAALDEAAPVGVETLKEDARIQVQLNLGAAFRWGFFEDAWRALADDRKAKRYGRKRGGRTRAGDARENMSDLRRANSVPKCLFEQLASEESPIKRWEGGDANRRRALR
jgi:hypothetical protein